MSPQQSSIDIFCRVVDNYGDIGVCWRLARQLAAERGWAARLIVDDLAAFARLRPGVQQNAAVQEIEGVIVLRWDEATLPALYGASGRAVIEAFACDLPDFVVEKMIKAAPAPVWIDLEYLSAEDWVETRHAHPSVHPTNGLMKTLFFPGFTERTGGLVREDGLARDRDAFQADTGAQNEWRARWDLPPLDPAILDISLFCYPAAPVPALLQALAGKPVRLFVPAGAAPLPDVRPGFVHETPFLPQPGYDRLLWTCGLNFVRGEDSLVRALWAGRPLVWDIYKQEKAAHIPKLAAFLACYKAGMAAQDAESLAQFTLMWNQSPRCGEAFTAFYESLPALSVHARDWAARQEKTSDLATRLLRFIESQMTK